MKSSPASGGSNATEGFGGRGDGSEFAEDESRVFGSVVPWAGEESGVDSLAERVICSSVRVGRYHIAAVFITGECTSSHTHSNELTELV